jgi:hypothetical protein
LFSFGANFLYGGPAFEAFDSIGKQTVMCHNKTRLDYNSNWDHLAFVFNSTDKMVKIYINGQNFFQIIASSLRPDNLIRMENYVGKSNLGESIFPYPSVNYDEIKIFNAALNPTEIEFEMNNQMFN